jgi:hypothetical protein
MKLPRRNFLHLAAGAAALPAVSRVTWAQAYPTRPVRIIVAVAAGGTSDILARMMGQWLSDRLGHPFVIENRPGGGGNIATEAVVRAPADGYTLLQVSAAAAINATLYDKLNFNFIRDITPVASIDREPLIMVVSSSVPGRGEYGPRALSRRGPRACRSARRTGAGHVRQHVLSDRIRQERQAPRAGGDHRNAFGGAAADPDRFGS